MATNGYKDVQVTPYDTLRFSWSIFEQNIETNTSMVHWNMYLIAGSSGRIDSNTTRTWSVIIDGSTYSGTNTVGIGNNESKLLASGAKMIWHNADGTKTFSYSFNQSIAITFSGNWIGVVSGSGTGELTSIPRAATINSAPNFTDSDNPTITYSNPAGSAVYGLQACISWTGADDIAYRNIPTNGTSYTFNLTDAERTKLRNAVTSGTSRNVTFYVTTWFTAGGNPTYSTLNRTFTINNAHPTITSFEAVDANDATVNLTGNDKTWVRGYSDIGFNITAQGNQGATIASYKATISNQTVNSSSGTIKANSDTITATVTDNRGNSTSATIKAERFIDYTPITCGFRNVEFSVDGEKGKLDFTIAGNHFNGSFGAVDNGLSVYYRYKAEDEEYVDWIEATPEKTNNGYSYAVPIAELDYTKNYYIQAKAADSLISVTSEEYKISKVIPVFDWSETDFNFNVPTYTPALMLKDNTGVYNQYSDGTTKDIMRVGTNDYLYIGTGGKTDSVGGTYIGGDSVNIIANKFAAIEAPSGVTINGSMLNDFVIEQGTSGDWAYRKWNSGLCEMWGWCQPEYKDTYYMSSYQAFPVQLTSWLSAIGTINSYGGNLASYLTTNVKIECFLYGCNVWVQNSNNSFTAGSYCDVSIHIIGRWK